jgi:drug/metabolite transporter (DMT)-like permease
VRIELQSFAEPTTPAHRLKAYILGLVAAAIFASTFVLNRTIALDGGHWAWTASLRYLLTLPLLLLIVAARGHLGVLLTSLARRPCAWALWGTIGFAFFYVPLALASALAPAWTIAALWQLTIPCGIAVAPFLFRDQRGQLATRSLVACVPLLVGTLLLQVDAAGRSSTNVALTVLMLMLVSATAFPAGNRKMMALLESEPSIDSLTRVAGMTIGSLPAWIMLSVIGLFDAGPPPEKQILASALVAIASGVIATTAYFAATRLVDRDPVALASVEATQAAEVPFSLGLEIVLLGAAPPGPLGAMGLLMLIGGIALQARLAHRRATISDKSLTRLTPLKAAGSNE